jgi:hypothetical protein
MKLNPTYHVLVANGSHELVEELQYLQENLEDSELNISSWVVLMNRLDEFKNLMQRATPDWKVTSREDFKEKFEEDEVEIWDRNAVPA